MKQKPDVGNSTKGKAAHRKFVEAEIQKLIGNSQLPAARYEEYIADALKDESILEEWRALSPKPPGIPPLNLPPTKILDDEQQAIHDEKTNKAFEKFFPHDWWKNSFFDDNVQEILNQWHPDSAPAGLALRDEDFAAPIRAWKVCDSAVLSQYSEPCAADLINFLSDTVSWGGRLLVAVQQFYEQGGRKMREPKTQADLFRQWADWRYFEATSEIRPQEPPHKYAEAVDEIKKAFSKVIRANNLSVTEGALRKFMHDENARRNSIMQRWEKNFEAAHKCWFDDLLKKAATAEKELPH
jgi:hypothetical protein